MRTRQIQKFALFRKQRALIILWRTLDNKFAIKMNLNRREQAVLKHFCLSYCCLSCPTELQVWLPCFSPFMLAMKQPLVPLETDSTMLQLQIHSVASLYLMKGKSGNLLLMNLECKKMPPFAENGIKLLVQEKLWLEPIQNLMKDLYRDRAGGRS